MSENEEFSSVTKLVGWLKRRGMKDDDIDAVKQVLWDAKFRSSFTLIGTPADDFKQVGITIPDANLLSNFLKEEPIAKRKKMELNAFDNEYLNGIVADGTWEDQEKGFTFKGRNQFVDKVENYLIVHLHSPPASPETQAEEPFEDTEEPEDKEVVCDLNVSSVMTPPDTEPSFSLAISEAPSKKRAKALVYSSVSGTGKTVSMLELKRLLHKNNRQVIVAYLGFNCCLELQEEEKRHILGSSNFNEYIFRAREVLARRLVASTIISLRNPGEVSRLPQGENIYKGYEIPTVDESKRLLLEGTEATADNPIYVVAGVDEVQLLNNELPDGPGLGRLSLRILREWQYEWYQDGIRLLPVGTGIAIDWSSDPTLGYNIPLYGGDTTLISKEDFKSLVEDVITGFIKENKFIQRFGEGVGKDTVIDVVSSAYWPRVRLVEFLKNGDMDILGTRALDDNAKEYWLTWLCHWLRDEEMPCDNEAVPGKGNSEGKIHTLFTLASDSMFRVIPDGYTSSSLIRVLKQKLEVPGLYTNLDVVKSLNPHEFMLRDAYEFDKLGFHVVGAAIHVGMYALHNSELDITLDNATPKQKRRLGLALWFLYEGAVTHIGEILVPRVLGKATSLSGEDRDFYPFEGTAQTIFIKQVVEALSSAKDTQRPVYIRCGRRAICDYLYFYICGSDENEMPQFICIIADAKHSCKNGTSISTSDQEQLFKALISVHSAMIAEKLSLKVVRLVFVTNKTKLSAGKPDSGAMKTLQMQRTSAQTIFPGVNQEMLNMENFEFSPFSDILSATRPS